MDQSKVLGGVVSSTVAWSVLKFGVVEVNLLQLSSDASLLSKLTKGPKTHRFRMMGLVGTSHILSSRLLQTPTTCRHAVPLLRAALSLRHETLRSMSSDGSSKAPATPSSSRLRGTTCMVTGGASGIGFAIAQRFLREGAGKIILVGRRKERLTDALDRLRGEHAGISQETYERGHGDDADAKYSAAQGMSDETSSDDGSWTGERTLSSVKTQDSSRHGSEGSHRSDSDRLALIAGDVGDSSFWSDDVKKAMVSIQSLRLPKLHISPNPRASG